MRNSTLMFCKGFGDLFINKTSNEISNLCIITNASAYIGSEYPVSWTSFDSFDTKSVSSPIYLWIGTSLIFSSERSTSFIFDLPFKLLITIKSSGCFAIWTSLTEEFFASISLIYLHSFLDLIYYEVFCIHL